MTLNPEHPKKSPSQPHSSPPPTKAPQGYSSLIFGTPAVCPTHGTPERLPCVCPNPGTPERLPMPIRLHPGHPRKATLGPPIFTRDILDRYPWATPFRAPQKGSPMRPSTQNNTVRSCEAVPLHLEHSRRALLDVPQHRHPRKSPQGHPSPPTAPQKGSPGVLEHPRKLSFT